jgi:peptidase A4-like protein
LSGHWVGLDGFRSGTVEQTGVVAACNGTTAVYRAFWEMFPNLPGFPSITITPGDKINMNVFYNRFTRKFTLTFSDTTTGKSFTRTRACPAGVTCRRNSAEAISEAPSDAATGDVLPLANFNRASFTNVAVTNTSGTHRGGLRSAFWNTFKITQVSDGTNTTGTGAVIPAGTVLDSPTFLALKRNFTNRWQAANG